MEASRLSCLLDLHYLGTLCTRGFPEIRGTLLGVPEQGSWYIGVYIGVPLLRETTIFSRPTFLRESRSWVFLLKSKAFGLGRMSKGFGLGLRVRFRV